MTQKQSLNFDELKYILNQYNLNGLVENIQAFGNGLINNTYKISIFDGYEREEFILQKINTNVFKDVDGLMNNIDIVTHHISNKIRRAEENPQRRTINMLETNAGKKYVFTNYGSYRVYKSIENACSFDIPKDCLAVEQTGMAFGDFHKQLLDLDTTRLVETIPNFHNTEVKFREFKKAVKADKVQRLSNAADIVGFAIERFNYASSITKKIKSGLPIRATHNDPKFNNILFDEDTLQPIAVIDLDTMMPGPIAYDFGDAIRSACNTASESETELSKVTFDIEKFEAFTKGYFESMQDNLTEREVKTLVDGCFTITYELGLRFLTDYLNGDKYFKINYPEHNLTRSAVQFKLLSSMEEQKSKMNHIVNKYADLQFEDQDD